MARLLSVLAFLVPAQQAAAAPIDRHALVARHDVRLSRIDPHAPVMLGNGTIGFTADVTGLQTFPEAYAPQSPLLTMAQWAWHSFPNPNGWSERDGLTPVDVPGRGTQLYPWIRDWSEVDRKPALAWLRENPHRFSLGRVALRLVHQDGRLAKAGDLTGISQHLDLWTGTLTSRFRFDGVPAVLVTRVLPGRDAIAVDVRSALIRQGRLEIAVRYPGVGKLNPDPSAWDRPEQHSTERLASGAGWISLARRIDDTRYWSAIVAPGARVTRPDMHEVRISRAGAAGLQAIVSFDRRPGLALPDLAHAAQRTAAFWRSYWTSGAAIDFSGTADPRAAELERRIVLSQYLAAVNQSGGLPPQEEGLFSNSWNGKFHLEMQVFHLGHFAAWGRPDRLEQTLGWYLGNLPSAQATARAHGVQGAWWTKMAGPEGRNSPSTINPFIMWQQPMPIYLAEMVRRAHKQDPAVRARYGLLVEETARLLASWPQRGADGLHHLGPPIIPVQETHPPLGTADPAFERDYYRGALEIAQDWRRAQGKAADPAWDAVIAGLTPLAPRDGLIPPVSDAPDFWARTLSQACSRNAVGDCPNRDHPFMVMSYGLAAHSHLAPDAVRRTLEVVKAHWDYGRMWGWDFPLLAMTAARLGDAEGAIGWLFADAANNRWGPTGMTPRFDHAAPGEAGDSLVPGYRRIANTYFPSNGSLLLATAMMAQAGEKGRPLFPKGWTVRAEGFVSLP